MTEIGQADDSVNVYRGFEELVKWLNMVKTNSLVFLTWRKAHDCPINDGKDLESQEILS